LNDSGGASTEVLPKEVKFMIGAIAGSIAVWFSARGRGSIAGARVG
jgi:hypothetical protein